MLRSQTERIRIESNAHIPRGVVGILEAETKLLRITTDLLNPHRALKQHPETVGVFVDLCGMWGSYENYRWDHFATGAERR